MKRLEKLRLISFDALFIALIVLFTFVNYLGYITLGAITLTTMPVLVLMGAAIFGWKRGLLYGFVFGLFSMIRAITMPTGPIDIIYQNPFISILPRAIFGLVAGLVFDVVKKHSTLKTYYISLPFLACGLSLLHSVLTLSCLYLFGILDPFGITAALGISEFFNPFKNVGQFIMVGLGTVTLFGMIGEAVLAFLVVPTGYFAIRRVRYVKEMDDKKFIKLVEKPKVSKVNP